MRIGVLASHGGTTLQCVIDAIEAGELAADVVAVVSNNSRSGALERARRHEIPTAHLSAATHADPDALDAAICAVLRSHSADVVLLAGYMKRLGPEVLAEYSGRILNTHPSLLPKFGGAGFYGLKVHEAVLAAGETVTGATVHVVTADYDEGPIEGQTEVAVLAGDTPEQLQDRVKTAEQRLLVSVLSEWAKRWPRDHQSRA